MTPEPGGFLGKYPRRHAFRTEMSRNAGNCFPNLASFGTLKSVISCLLFDLDGTLVDSLPGIANSLNRTLDAHGMPGLSHEHVRSIIGKGLPHLIRNAAPAGTDAAAIDSLLALYRRDYSLTWRDGSQLYDGVAAMLDQLQRRHLPLAVLTNKTHEFAVEMVAELFPSVPFQPVVGIRDGTPHKPDPSAALYIAGILGVDPSSCALVGDSTMDLETACNAGMAGIGACWGYHDRPRLAAAGATRLIAHPAELPALLTEKPS